MRSERQQSTGPTLRRLPIFDPGERTGKYRLGKDQLLMDEQGQSRISMEDYAIAMVDELESAKNIRRKMTVGY